MKTRIEKIKAMAERNWRFFAKVEPFLERERLREQARVNAAAALVAKKARGMAAKAFRKFQRIAARLEWFAHIRFLKNHMPHAYSWGVDDDCCVIER